MMRRAIILGAVLLLVGCGRADRKFHVDIDRYEKVCADHYRVYFTGDVATAKDALHQIITLSLAEQERAKGYWRFDHQIACAYARLAVIADYEGEKDEAERLFAKASEFDLAQQKAFRAYLRSKPNVYSSEEDSDEYAARSVAEWKSFVDYLDSEFGVKWKEPNQSAQTTPVSAPR